MQRSWYILAIPSSHLSGHGCKKCGRNKAATATKLTTKEFIERANIEHKCKYDYSKVEYEHNKKKVSIICPIHGSFLQEPGHHLNGHGCKPCGRISQAILTKLTTEEFIEMAKIENKDKYDYSLVNYFRGDYLVNIICPIHGVFKKRPNQHLAGQGCQKCARKNRPNFTTETFVIKAETEHGKGKYDYSLVDYKNSKDKVIIICQKHGEFKVSPHGHLSGKNCRKCSNEDNTNRKKLTTEKFIIKSNSVHGVGKFDYSLVNYTLGKTKVPILCQKHGPFMQSAAVHMAGHGCPACKESQGESGIELFLKETNRAFERSKYFINCKNPITGCLLEFDFYVEDDKVLVEFDGPQHEFPNLWFAGGNKELAQQKFNEQVFRDNYKNNWALENGYTLLRISYKYKKRVYKILKQFFDNLNKH